AEDEKRRVEEERVRAEAEQQRRAEEEQRRTEEERQRAEAERRSAEEAARLAEEQRRHNEAIRLAEEERAQAEARRRAEEEEAERRRAQLEAERRAEEERRLESEAAARRELEEAASASAVKAVEPVRDIESIMMDIESTSIEVVESVEQVDYAEPLIERNDGGSGWVEIDLSEPEIVRHAQPIRSTPKPEPVQEERETFILSNDEAEPVMVEPEFETAEPFIGQPAATEPAPPSIAGMQIDTSVKDIAPAVQDKGIAPIGDEFLGVPSSVLKRLSSEDETERAQAVSDLGRVGGDDSFRQITAAFDDPSVEVRNAAARTLYQINTDRAATFTRALREAPPERRRQIGASLATSGLANEAIGHLMGESREKTYDAFSLLFLMSKAGEVQPLMRAIEEHPNNEVRLAVVKLLALSGQQEILPAFRRLAVRGSLPPEVRSAVMEAIYQISSQASESTSAA
ncbi:MAG TPA: HEAT repeat domain-containing protein, partial [Pyrinomonadaceae bacterium]|nr:HEAT repeat domain-containing protein [Pyrinomonadaceae bacterium]